MTIIKFTTPSDSEIINDIPKIEATINFIGNGSVYQSLKETTYERFIKIPDENLVKKVIYKKKGVIWGFQSIEDVAS